MITPQEAESHVFSKSSFGSGGYNMAQVDTFLDTLLVDYSALYKENATLKGKMKVLVEKIEEYRTTEDAMRMTLLSAQKMADGMVKEAEIKKEEAIAKAESESKSKVEQLRRELANEELRLNAARNSTAAYVTRLKDLYTREVEYIGNLSELVSGSAENDQKATATHVAPADHVDPPAPEEVAPLVQFQPEPAPEPDVPYVTVETKPDAEEAKPAADDEGENDTLVFDRLEFGKDYDFE